MIGHPINLWELGLKLKKLSMRMQILTLTMAGWFFANAVHGQVVEQVFELNEGWNAIFLEVEPELRSTATVFRDVPISSVWTWKPRSSSVDFIQNPDEGQWNRPGWLSFFPPTRAESLVTNLHILQANRAYLIDMDADFTLRLSGRPDI